MMRDYMNLKEGDPLSVQEIQEASTGTPRNIYRRKLAKKTLTTDSYRVGNSVAVVQSTELPTYVEFRSGSTITSYEIRGGKITRATTREE